MNTQEFNEKYAEWLEEGHYGLAISGDDVIDYLDNEFEIEIEANPDFSFSQIKMKFNYPSVYTNSDMNRIWESKINSLVNPPSKIAYDCAKIIVEAYEDNLNK